LLYPWHSDGLIVKHKNLIYYQRDSAKAEPAEDPFLPVKI